MLDAVSTFLLRYGDRIDEESFIRRLGKESPGDLRTRARTDAQRYGGKPGAELVGAFVKVYNARRHAGLLSQHGEK